MISCSAMLGSCAAFAPSRSSATLPLSQGTPEKDAEKVAQELANPLAPITTLAAQYRGEFGAGPDHETNQQLRLQPSFYVPFEGDSALLVRSILPVRFQDWPEQQTGLGDLAIIPYFVPNTRAAHFIGYGAAFGFDTASDETLGSGRTTAGPAILFAASGPTITWGGLFQHVWSVDHSATRSDVDVSTAQPFVTMLLGDGWAATLSSEVTYNWELDSDDAWTIPVAAATSKVVQIGDQYLNLGLGYVQYVEAPQYAQDWELRLSLTYVLR